MTQKEFTQAYLEFRKKFPNFKNSFVLIDTSAELHNASEGDALEVIKCMIELANKNPLFHAVFLTVGEFLRSDLSASEINSLTKLHLEKVTRENAN